MLSAPELGGADPAELRIALDVGVDPRIGRAAVRVPLDLTGGRNGFGPELTLSYSSSGAAGACGAGWFLDGVPTIEVSTRRGLPTYDSRDGYASTVAGELVPALIWQGGAWLPRVETRGGYAVRHWRGRRDHHRIRVEQWVELTTGQVHWRTRDVADVLTVYGQDPAFRIADPADPTRVFAWLPQAQYDPHGNAIVFEYAPETLDGVDRTAPYERTRRPTLAQRYLKHIRYANSHPITADTAVPAANRWHLEIVFDYGDHPANRPAPDAAWLIRPDPRSSCRPGFEVRTYRLLRRVLQFHHFDPLGADPVLVGAYRFQYAEDPAGSTLAALRYTGYHVDGSQRALPPLRFEYTQPQADPAFAAAPAQTLAQVPGGLGSGFRWLDLFGEGLPGLLTETENAWYYAPNEGGGRFGARRLVVDRPAHHLGQVALADFAADGDPKLAVLHSSGGGFYTYARDAGFWEGFRPFDALPHLEAAGGRAQWLDVNGDGRAELVFADAERLTWFPALGAGAGGGYGSGAGPGSGFGDPVTVPAPAAGEGHGPAPPGAEGRDFHFADMTGDGLADQVRVRNGRIEYWPHLGHGRFGPPVLMEGAPTFASDAAFDPARLMLADVDGDGVADLIYLGNDGIRWWHNEGGNRLVEGGGLAETATVDGLSAVAVLDFLGDGMPCLVWSSPVPGAGTALRYARLTGGERPYLLRAIHTSTGAEHRLSYGSSGSHYLCDRAAGRPWPTRLPVHPWVVERHDIIDHIGGTHSAVRYAYHDGRYDPVERASVFGSVDAFDVFDGAVDAVDAVDAVGAVDGADEPAGAASTRPSCTRTWYHTGAVNMSLVDTYAADAAAALLAPYVVAEPELLRAGEYEQAVAALAGCALREELYAVEDGGALAAHPFHVTQHSYEVRRLQPGRPSSATGTERDPVFEVAEAEQLAAVYEAAADDPRVSHDLVLERDAYGLVAMSATVAYPRRPGASDLVPAQQRLQLRVTVHRQTQVDTADRFVLGVPVEEREYELTGCVPGARGVFDRARLRADVLGAITNAVPVHGTPPAGVPGARLVDWEQTYYWDDAGTGPLPLGVLGTRVLTHHSESARFTPQLLAEHYADLPAGAVTPTMLSVLGYVLRNGYWWQTSEVAQHAGAAGFYLPTGFVRRDGGSASVGYDTAWLVPVTVTDQVQNTTTAVLDYHHLEPVRVTDANGAIEEVLLDPLGVAVVATSYGTVPTAGGGTAAYGQRPLSAYQPPAATAVDAALADPAGHLQGAAAVVRYELSWAPGSAPPRVLHLIRENLADDGTGAAPAPCRIGIQVSHLDAFGRPLQSKSLVEPGEAVLRDGNGALVRGAGDAIMQGPVQQRWHASGHVRYNRKQEPVREYDPYYSCTVDYEAEVELATFGTARTTTYDAVGRSIREDLPDGTHTRTVHAAWSVTEFDLNDTVLDSGYRLLREHLPVGDPERDAYDKATAHANTPQRHLLDPIGEVVVRVSVAPAGGTDRTMAVERDGDGHETGMVDGRGVRILGYGRDMGGRVLRAWSAEAGTAWHLPDAYDRPAHSWDSRGVHLRRRFDAADRPVSSTVDGALGLNHRTEEIVYGDDPSIVDGAARNARGRPVLHRDQAGTLEHLAYSPGGEPLRVERLLRTDYDSEPDWAGAVALQTQAYTSEYTYDGLERVLAQRLPDGTERRCEYLAGGGLSRVLFSTSDGQVTDLAVLDGVTVTAAGHRSRARLGNGIELTRGYDPETGRTTRITARRGTLALQDLTYTYDPVGNVVRREDLAQRPTGPVIPGLTVTAESSYTYDEIYQLVEATGRVHQSLLEHDYRPRAAGTMRGTRHLSFNNGAAVERYQRTYRYDASGNLGRVRHAGSTRTWTTDLWVAPDSNRSVPALDPAGNPVAQPASAFDASGNITALAHLRALVWSYRGGLARAVVVDRSGTGAPDDAEFYVYDATGARIRKVFHRLVNGALEVTEKVYLDGCEIKRIRNDGALTLERTTSHVADETGRLALVHRWTVDSAARETDDITAVRIRYALTDHLDSAQLELDEAGSVIAYEEYFPFGGTSFVAGDAVREVAARDYRFCGKECDEATGLYYSGQRYYAAWLGRWLSPDPSGPEDDENLYRYVGNNPVNLSDPDGLAAETPRQGRIIHQQTTEVPVGLKDSGLTREQIDLVDQKKGVLIFPPGEGSKPVFVPNHLLNDVLAEAKKLGKDIVFLHYAAPKPAAAHPPKPPPPKKPPQQPPAVSVPSDQAPAGDAGVLSDEAAQGGERAPITSAPAADAGAGPNAADPAATAGQGGVKDGADGGAATASQRPDASPPSSSSPPPAGTPATTGAGTGRGQTGAQGTGGVGPAATPTGTGGGQDQPDAGGGGTAEDSAPGGVAGGVAGGLEGGEAQGDLQGALDGSLGGRADTQQQAGPEVPPGAVSPPAQTASAGSGTGNGTGTGTGSGAGGDAQSGAQRRAGGHGKGVGSGGGTGGGKLGQGADASGSGGKPGAEAHDLQDKLAAAAGVANLDFADDEGQHGGVPGGMGAVRGHGAQYFYIALTIASLLVSAAKALKKGVTTTLRQAFKSVAKLFTKKFWSALRKQAAKKLSKAALKRLGKSLVRKVTRVFTKRFWRNAWRRVGVNWRRFRRYLTSVRRFIWDARDFEKQVSPGYWRPRGGAKGWQLHHWLFPQRATWIPTGLRNAGFNLIALPGRWNGFFDWKYGVLTTRWFASRGAGWLVRIVIPASLYGGYVIGTEGEKRLDGKAGAPPNPRLP